MRNELIEIENRELIIYFILDSRDGWNYLNIIDRPKFQSTIKVWCIFGEAENQKKENRFHYTLSRSNLSTR